jgi:hypothetical protein
MSLSRMFSLLFAACVIAAAALANSPARAGDYIYFGGYCYRFYNAPDCFRDTQRAIYHKQNLIAHLEANPDVDESYKSVTIPWARAEVHHLRAFTGIRHHWRPTPCCYRLQSIYIR